MAVAVVDSQGRSVEAVAGFADIENEKAFSPDTVFPIASISKGVIGILMGLLVQRNQVNWSDNVARFDEPARSTIIALGEFQMGLPLDQNLCLLPVRHSCLAANPENTQAWQTGCDCGKCNSTHRGI